MVVPDFLEKFRPQIEKYKLNSIKIKAHPISDSEVLNLEQSKFLGKPFLPNDLPYPKDKNGKPMILLAQINFAEIPFLENYPTEGLLQLFVSATDWYSMDDYSILYHPNTNFQPRKDFSFLTSDLYSEAPIYTEHALTFIKTTEYGATEDFRFDMRFNGLSYYEYRETLSKEQQKKMDDIFYIIGHKIGGYAYFTQSDPRSYSTEHKWNDLLILQIDSDDKIMFGDSGVAHVFLNEQDLKNRDFSKAYFYWDCC